MFADSIPLIWLVLFLATDVGFVLFTFLCVWMDSEYSSLMDKYLTMTTAEYTGNRHTSSTVHVHANKLSILATGHTSIQYSTHEHAEYTENRPYR